MCKFEVCAFPQTGDICRNVSRKFTELSMETPCWCTSDVHQYGGRNIVHIDIWKLLWLSGRLIIFTEQTSIYINTFPNTLTSKKATNHEIVIYFSTNAIVALVSKRSTLLGCQIVNRYKYTVSYA